MEYLTGSGEHRDPVDPELPVPPLWTIPNHSTIRLASPGYPDIEVVPPPAIRKLSMNSLLRSGSTDEGVLMKEVARRLGF